jgi:hypothetical protein
MSIPAGAAGRGERNGWTGDAAFASESECFDFDTAAFFSRSVQNVGFPLDPCHTRWPSSAPTHTQCGRRSHAHALAIHRRNIASTHARTSFASELVGHCINALSHLTSPTLAVFNNRRNRTITQVPGAAERFTSPERGDRRRVSQPGHNANDASPSTADSHGPVVVCRVSGCRVRSLSSQPCMCCHVPNCRVLALTCQSRMWCHVPHGRVRSLSSQPCTCCHVSHCGVLALTSQSRMWRPVSFCCCMSAVVSCA